MKITTLIAAAALATASTAAVADVTTADGAVVIIEKNQMDMPLIAQFGAAAIALAITAAALSSGSGS